MRSDPSAPRGPMRMGAGVERQRVRESEKNILVPSSVHRFVRPATSPHTASIILRGLYIINHIVS